MSGDIVTIIGGVVGVQILKDMVITYLTTRRNGRNGNGKMSAVELERWKGERIANEQVVNVRLTNIEHKIDDMVTRLNQQQELLTQIVKEVENE